MEDLIYTPMEESFDWNEGNKDLVERYYVRKYCVGVTDSGDDYCVLIHSNRVCLICLAPSHRLIVEKKRIVKLDWEVGKGVNRLANTVSGKWKHGAQRLKPSSPLAIAVCEDGTRLQLNSAITGKLIEINASLLDQPSLLLDDPIGAGYLAIVLPEIKTCDIYRNSLLSQEEYEAKVQKNRSASST
nr:simiate [Hydrometra stagnorum]